MHTPTGGRLLDRVCYCMRPPCVANNILDEPITVRDTFPYNPESKTAPGTAKRWAEPAYYDTKNKGYVAEVIERDNSPFSITITDLHVRSEGGRAYKVIDDDMRRFDLREDQVMEVMRNIGILPGGKIAGQFVWGILGSQVRLVLVDGELYKDMVAGAHNKKEYENAQSAGLHPTESTLVPGHVYRKKNKSLHLFLGRVKHPFATKAQFAFVEMPAAEDRTGDDPDKYEYADAEWKAARKLENETYTRFNTLSWRERCEFSWVARWKAIGVHHENPYTMYPDIVFMSSPKFEADAGEVEADLFQEIKANKKNQHSYFNQRSILEAQFKKAHPDEQGYLATGDVWYSWDRANVERMTQAWRKFKQDFYDGLAWLT